MAAKKKRKSALPMKYMKMGLKKGWREYKKTDAYKRKMGKTPKSSSTKKKKAPAKKKSSTKKKTTTKAVAKTTSRAPAKKKAASNPRKERGMFKIPKFKTLIRRSAKKIGHTGVALLGAGGTTVAINMAPIPLAAKGLGTALAGLTLASFMQEKNKWGQLAAGGAIFVGLARLAQSFVPDVPLLAGPARLGAPAPRPLEDSSMNGIIDFKLSGPADFAGPADLSQPTDMGGMHDFSEPEEMRGPARFGNTREYGNQGTNFSGYDNQAMY